MGDKMLNLLVADDNIYYAKTLINYIVDMNKDIRLINLSTDGKEALENIYCNAIDLIILDLKMPVVSGIDVLKKMKELNLDPLPTIIVISGEMELIKEIRNNEIVSAFIDKSVGLEKINLEVAEVIRQKHMKDNKQNIRKKIKQELLSLGFNIKHIGTTYITEAIELAYEINNREYCENLEKYLYNKIAKIHWKSVQNIKTNIAKATKFMYLNCNRDFLMRYFHFTYDYKPTQKIIINTVLYKL